MDVNSGVSGTDAAGEAPPGTGGNRGGSSAYTAGDNKDVSVCFALAEEGPAGAVEWSMGMVARFGCPLDLKRKWQAVQARLQKARRQPKDVVASQASTSNLREGRQLAVPVVDRGAGQWS